MGFEAIYITGAGVTNMWFGLPDQGFMGLAEIADHTARIRDAVSLPLIVDADTGFGNALNVSHTVRTLERAGADCIQFEDQIAPKRCGHFAGKDVIPIEEAVNKIKAAADARQDADLLILARTDACAVYGFEAAIERAQRFAEAGADILFVEAVTTADEIRALPRRLDRPQLMNMVVGGKTPIFSAEDLGGMGYGLVLYANAALQGALRGMGSVALSNFCQKMVLILLNNFSWKLLNATEPRNELWQISVRPKLSCCSHCLVIFSPNSTASSGVVDVKALSNASRALSFCR